MADTSALPAPASLPGLAERLEAELGAIDAELAEIDMLVAQARTEAGRHEARRAQATEKLAGKGGKGEAKDIVEAYAQLATLTRRAAVMEAQVEVLEGKRKVLARFRDSLAGYAAAIVPLAQGGGPVGGSDGAGGLDPDAPPAVSQAILRAQEDLRREIARAMHDGPAQSLTNIVLQAQIVDRLLDRDPAWARGELAQLSAMVEQTLEATKTFIFDVRPMVLDDLGLVPTLRRMTRERGQRGPVQVGFETVGLDRRLAADTESGLYRIVDQVLGAYLAVGPDRVEVRLDWGDESLALDVSASRIEIEPAQDDETPPAPAEDLPPALAEMIEDRRRASSPVEPESIELPDATWRDVSARAASIGAVAELADGGSRIRIELAVPAAA
jgi:two-component system sensor histidine kinase DegS